MARRPPRWLQNALTGLHSTTVHLSRGRIGGRIGPAEVLLLTTTGRHSGRRRTVPLTFFPDGRDAILIASNGGAEQHPAWFHNLTADPAATVEHRGSRRKVRAEVVADPDERRRLWDGIVAVAPVYDGYAGRTDREIPVVRLRDATT